MHLSHDAQLDRNLGYRHRDGSPIEEGVEGRVFPEVRLGEIAAIDCTPSSFRQSERPLTSLTRYDWSDILR